MRFIVWYANFHGPDLVDVEAEDLNAVIASQEELSSCQAELQEDGSVTLGDHSVIPVMGPETITDLAMGLVDFVEDEGEALLEHESFEEAWNYYFWPYDEEGYISMPEDVRKETRRIFLELLEKMRNKEKSDDDPIHH